MNELLRDRAQQLIHQAVEAELSEYLSQHQRLTDDGRAAFDTAILSMIPVVTDDHIFIHNRLFLERYHQKRTSSPLPKGRSST